MGLLDLLVGDLLEVDAHLEEDDLQVEELLEAHNLLGMGTVDIDGVVVQDYCSLAFSFT